MSTKELREKDNTTLSGLRKRVVELELENNKLRELIPQVYCHNCKESVCPDGIFRRCGKQGMRIVGTHDFCSDGRPKK